MARRGVLVPQVAARRRRSRHVMRSRSQIAPAAGNPRGTARSSNSAWRATSGSPLARSTVQRGHQQRVVVPHVLHIRPVARSRFRTLRTYPTPDGSCGHIRPPSFEQPTCPVFSARVAPPNLGSRVAQRAQPEARRRVGVALAPCAVRDTDVRRHGSSDQSGTCSLGRDSARRATQILAFIESHLAHARALMRFLLPTDGVTPDMVAADYLEGPPPLPPAWSTFDADLELIDRELAHCVRALARRRSWALVAALTTALIAFVESAPEAACCPTPRRSRGPR